MDPGDRQGAHGPGHAQPLVMGPLTSTPVALFAMRLLAAAFLGILFLQSGVDKVVDRKGNLEWLTGHFAKSPLRGVVPLVLSTITLLELAAGVLSALGAVELALWSTTRLAFLGAIVAGAALVCLFLGQRLAKDYAGAAALVPYFLAALAAIGLLSANPW
jgi:hypothetical protein